MSLISSLQDWSWRLFRPLRGCPFRYLILYGLHFSFQFLFLIIYLNFTSAFSTITSLTGQYRYLPLWSEYKTTGFWKLPFEITAVISKLAFLFLHRKIRKLQKLLSPFTPSKKKTKEQLLINILLIKSFSNYKGFLVDRLNSNSFQDPRGAKEKTISA